MLLVLQYLVSVLLRGGRAITLGRKTDVVLYVFDYEHVITAFGVSLYYIEGSKEIISKYVIIVVNFRII